jgi:DNA-directed RNA polymerase subunit B
MPLKTSLLIRKYFEENNFVQSNIESFNGFTDWRLQKLVDEIGSATPAVIPPETEEVRFTFGKIRIEKPSLIEADGAKRKIAPIEARIRDLTYAAPVFMEVSMVIDGKERERAELQVAELPIMLKSKLCYLNGLGKEELIVAGEDPLDAGGYFIINGTERALSLLEDLAANNIFVAKVKSGPVTHHARIFSSSPQYKIPHALERTKDGQLLLSFAGFKRIPLTVVLKALGFAKDSDLPKLINLEGSDEDIYLNLFDFVEMKSEKDGQDFIAKSMGILPDDEQKYQRVNYMLDNFLLPHIGAKPEDRQKKAVFLGRMAKKLLLYKAGKIKKDDRDHYMNKRVRLAGDLLEDLFRANLKILVNDMLYIFQRGVRRGKVLPLTSIVRSKLLTQRVKSAMATGNWTGNRQGVSQRLERDNALATLSHLQRVTSLLEASRESFEARELHPTHWGRLCPLETPEGKHVGLRKNLALLAQITPELKRDEYAQIEKSLEQFGLSNGGQGVDVFYNGFLVGQVQEPAQFVDSVKSARRSGAVSRLLNIHYKKKQGIVQVTTEKNRIRRPLIVVRDSKALVTEEHLKKMELGELKWSDLVNEGVIEYLDALEEEGALIAIDDSNIVEKHTHMEVNPLAIFGISTSMAPYANFNQSSKLYRGQKGQKQAMGVYALNYLNRIDTAVNLLHYPQKPLVRSITHEVFGNELSAGQNVVIAVIDYEGYNMSDALVVNKASLERGFGRSTYYRPYITEKLRYPGGQVDEVCIPTKDAQGYTLEKDYRFIDQDGITYPEVEVRGGDVLIGKTSPPRFLGKLEAFSSVANVRKNTSVRVRYGEGGMVTKVVVTESEDGSQLIKAELRDTRQPEIGDKFSARAGQKGVIGLIVNPEDMPFTQSGVVPDILFSPNGLPKRMTAGHMIECLGGKAAALRGEHINGTSFQSEFIGDMRAQLLALGFRDDGTEVLYDGRSGRQYPVRIFVGSLYYNRLKHQVADKVQSRTRGPVALLTRQPTEGKAKEGGLRLGEMEKDVFVAHGSSLLMKERFDSDRAIVWLCDKCGDNAIFDSYKNKALCLNCGEKNKVFPIEMSYAFKLFLDELRAMHMRPKLILEDKY